MHKRGVRGRRVKISATSYHEAGHALAALREGRNVKGIYVSQALPGAGVCFHRLGSRNPYDPSNGTGSAVAAWTHTFATSLADIRIGLAGPLAEAKALGQPLRTLGSKSDLDRCIYLAQRLNVLHHFLTGFIKIAPIDPRRLLDTEKRKVRRWLGHPSTWSAIETIAKALELDNRLSGPELNDVIGLAMTPKKQGHFAFAVGKAGPRTNRRSQSGFFLGVPGTRMQPRLLGSWLIG
jgi:hypothetical protein